MTAVRLNGRSFVTAAPRLWSGARLAVPGPRNFALTLDGKRIAALMPVETSKSQNADNHLIFLFNAYEGNRLTRGLHSAGPFRAVSTSVARDDSPADPPQGSTSVATRERSAHSRTSVLLAFRVELPPCHLGPGWWRRSAGTAGVDVAALKNRQT